MFIRDHVILLVSLDKEYSNTCITVRPVQQRKCDATLCSALLTAQKEAVQTLSFAAVHRRKKALP